MNPVLSASLFAAPLSSRRGRGFPSLRDFPRGVDKRLSPSEPALCPGGSSTLQLGDRRPRGRFNGHLQQVGSKHFYCALEAPHTRVTAEYGLQDDISVNKSHFPSRKKRAFSCTLLHKQWSSYRTIITTETMATSNTALNSKFQLKSFLADF